MSQTTDAPAVPRDVRIDQIGFVNELQKQFVDKLKDGVKGRMLEGQSTVAEGDFFTATLAGVGSTVGTIDAVKVFRLVKSGRLKESEFLECCRVERGKLEEYLSGKDLDRLSEFRPASPALRVTRKKGVEVKLIDAIKGLGEAIRE